MTVCIFLGPTLPVAQAKATLDADYLPPVRQGDVYRAMRRYQPRAIGIIDGYFHQVPSVWHKEILFAMAEGVQVFGSASMGALRAAELHPFGMQGIGEVFSAFRNRQLEDDDEVAVVHAPEEIGFAAASEAMVNIRWTLDAADRQGVIGEAAAQKLKGIAKSLFYPERAYPEILKRAAAAGLPEDELAAFDDWLEQGRIDVKQRDALAMLEHIGRVLGDDFQPMSVDYTFEHTTMWEAATRTLRAEHDAGNSGSDPVIDGGLLDEILLDERANEELRRAALLRLLTFAEADRQGRGLDDDERRQALSAFRVRHKLHRASDLRDWLAARDWDRQTLERYLDDQLLLDKVADGISEPIARMAIDELRFRGDDDYRRLVTRAQAKRQSQETAEQDRELIGDLRAMMWYFEQQVGVQPPDDLNAYARQRGFRDGEDFKRAVIGEFLYVHRKDEAT